MEVKDHKISIKPTKMSKVVSSQDLLKIISNKRSSIEKIKFITARLGSGKMGRFYVELG
jgi:hypothetical protein